MSDVLGSGRLEDHPFAELSGLIFQENRTGELNLESGNHRRTVWFLGGNPVAVVSDDPQDHLARFLLEHGKINDEEAQRLAELPETREALGGADYISKETLNWGVKSRFVNLCYDLFRWEEGDYSFRDSEPPRELFLLKVPAHSLIFKGVGFLGQATVYDAVPDDAVCRPGVVAPSEARYLSAEAQQLLENCKPGLAVAAALAGSAADPEQARRLLYALVCLGVLGLSRGGGAAAATAMPDESAGFSLEDETFHDVAPPAPAATPADLREDADIPDFPLDDKPVHEPFSLNLPPLNADYGSLPETVSAREPAGTTQAPGTDPFEEEAGTTSFGSFGQDAPLDHEDEQQAPGDENREESTKAPRRAGSRFHIPRIAGIALGALAAVGIFAVAGWWWMGGSEPPPPPVKPPVRRPAPAGGAPVAAKPVPVPVPVPTPAPAPAAPASSAAPAPPVPAPPAARTPGPESAPAPVPAATALSPAPRPAAIAHGANGSNRYNNALDIFRAGDVDGAAGILEELLAQEHRDAFTLQLLTACERDTVKEVQRSLSSQPLYLITKKVKGRVCYRVCLGTFDSRDAAGRALAGLPGDYRAGGASIRAVADVLNRDR